MTVAVPMATSSSPKPLPASAGLGKALVKRLRSPDHFGIFCLRSIPAGTLLFTAADWVEDETRGWETLTVDEVEALSLADRERYLRYAYDIEFGAMVGTFDWTRARHISNFMNHSCAPNMVYGESDSILAARDITPGEELTIDYGNFIVNVDQSFRCTCNDPSCRKRILRHDWIALVPRLGMGFPTFMHDAVRRVGRTGRAQPSR